jgi:hypothetical protein
MSEITKNSDNFIAYEYKEITASRDMEGVYTDGYPNFGWQLDNADSSSIGFSAVRLRFKRDRKIRNKAELSRLQRQFESDITKIENLERSKTTFAIVSAITVGLVGTAFMAGSVFAFIYAEMIPLMIILALPGFVGWALPYFLYRKIKAKRETVAAGLIDEQYDAIYDVCGKANALLESGE